MRLRAKTYQRSGGFLFLGKLESDAFCETWRVVDVTSEPASPALAMRRFPGIPSESLKVGSTRVSGVLRDLRGPAIARQQRLAETGEGKVLIHEHEGGRSLALLVERARNGSAGRLPIPVDLSLAIAEKIALALAATHEFQYEDARAVHGGLLPHFVWITADGDVRITGQELWPCVYAALGNDRAASLVRPFLAPEVVMGAPPTPASDIYSAGALLFLMLTGEILPECRTADQNIDRIQGGRSWLTGDPLDEGLQEILIRSLPPEPTVRYSSAPEFREAIARRLHDGSSAPTTFNLAFYLHTLLRKDFERERAEQEVEARTDPAASLRSSPASPQHASPSRVKTRRRIFIVIAVSLVLASGIAAAYIRFSPSAPVRNEEVAATSVATQPIPPAPLPDADAVAEPAAPAGATATLDDSAAREAAFEAAVNARLQEEMLKLQARHDEEMRRQRQLNAGSPAPRATPTPAPSIQTPAVLAPEELERRRNEAAREPVPESNPAPTPPPEVTPPRPVSAREGELIELASVDTPPTVVRSVDPVYPPLARSRRIEGSVILSALISETGRVLEVRIMRGDSRKVGLDEAAVAAVRAWQFTPAMKDGQRVRTWMPVAVSFKMPR